MIRTESKSLECHLALRSSPTFTITPEGSKSVPTNGRKPHSPFQRFPQREVMLFPTLAKVCAPLPIRGKVNLQPNKRSMGSWIPPQGPIGVRFTRISS
jgi:hypothetical protein